MGIGYSPTEWVRRERRDNAERIALKVRVFVRKARANGADNLITELAIQEAAQELGIDGGGYTVRTVKTLVKSECQRNGELDLIAPRWGR